MTQPVAWMIVENHGGGKLTKTLTLEKPAEPSFPALKWYVELYAGPLINAALTI